MPRLLKGKMLSTSRLNALEAMLSVWGPLALNAELLRQSFPQCVEDMIPPWAAALPARTEFGECLSRDADGVEAQYTVVTAVGGRAVTGGKVAIIPIVGPVTPFPAPKFYEMFGIKVAALPSIVAAARAAATDPEVSRIVFAIHSPGGSAFGVGEAHAALRDVSKRKPTIAVATYMAASAAYWLGAAARTFIAEPSAIVGSVGARITHMDVSKALDMEGIAMTEISNPVSKSDLSQYKPLSDSAKAELKTLVDASYSQFAADISSSRGIDMVKNAEQYGRAHPAAVAHSIGLIDRVTTFEALLGEVPPMDDTTTRRARLAIMELKANA